MQILNLTIHNTTELESLSGLYDCSQKDIIIESNMFEEMPDNEELHVRAYMLLYIAETESSNVKTVLIGGSAYFIPIVKSIFETNGFKVIYKLSELD